jgi:predicted PurR-regulated permease PerM
VLWVFPLPAAGMEFVMMDKKPHIKPYLYGMLAGFGAIALSIIFFFLIYRFDGFGSAISTLTGILMPFIYGAVIAYLLKPVCNSIESFLRRFIPEKMNGLINALSVALTILFGLLLVYALVMMIVPQLITSVTTLYYTAQANITKFMNWANHLEFIENNEQIMELLNSAYAALNTNLDTWIKNTLLPSMQNIVSGAAIGVLNVVTVAKNLIIGIIVAVYMLASRKRFVQQGKLVLHSIVRPRWAQLITEEVKYADRMFGGFINGKIMDSAIIGVLCYIGCLIFKFPSALLVSVIIGVTNVIPFFGPFIGAIPATLLILIQNPIKALWFVLFVLVLQQLDGNIIGPKILGNTTGLSSFWVLFAILLFGGLWGFVGMIVGVPLFAVIYDVIKKLVIHGLQRNQELTLLNNYHDQFGDPADDAAAQPAAPQPAENQ